MAVPDFAWILPIRFKAGEELGITGNLRYNTATAMSTKTLTQERLHFTRAPWPAALGINLLQPPGAGPVNHVNMSEGGLCLRLPTRLEVRSLVRLQLTPADSLARRWRPMECTGRVAWVTQRLDLRAMPPYLFDVGIEFVNLPRSIHRRLTQQHIQVGAVKPRGSNHGKPLEPAVVKGRQFVPRLDPDGLRQARWHLIVTVGDVPCFSRHYPTEHEALAAWERFKRAQARGAKVTG